MRPDIPVPGAFAGRTGELKQLERQVEELARGAGSAILIEGDPGSGKTALVRAATAGRPAARVLWGTAAETSRGELLAPFLDALDVGTGPGRRRAAITRLLGGEGPAGVNVPAAVAEQARELVAEEAGTCPTVLVIDNLQWADRATVSLWGRLARNAGHMRLMLVGVTRAVPRRDDVAALRRAADGISRIRIGPLSRPEVAGLAGTLAGGTPDAGLLQLAGRAGGNPDYLTRLLGALRRSGGVTVTSGGEARLAACPDLESLAAASGIPRPDFVTAGTLEVIEEAALLSGTDARFSVSDLTTVLGVTIAGVQPALDEARRAGVIADPGDGTALAFAQPVIRDVLCSALFPAVRRVRHSRAAGALASAGAAPERVARQLLGALGAGAGETPVGEWVAGWLATAADSLVDRAPGAAADLLALAEGSVPAGSFRPGWLAARRAEALYRAGDRAGAAQVAEQAISGAADFDIIVPLHCTLAQCRLLAGDRAGVFRALDHALGTPGLTPGHRARLHARAANAHLYFGEPAAADDALAAAEAADGTVAAAEELKAAADRSLSGGDFAGALQLYDRGLALTAADPALRDLGLRVQVNRAVTLLMLDRCAGALDAAERVRHLADRAGSGLRLIQAHSALAQVLYITGQWDKALAEIGALDDARKDDETVCCDHGMAADIAFHRNDPAAARRHLAAAEQPAERLGQRQVSELLRARSLELEQAGARDEALAVLRPAWAADAGHAGELEELLTDAVRLAVKSGNEAAAKDITVLAAARAAGSAIPHQQGNALYCQGMVGRDAAALTAAAQRYADAGRPLARARALEAAAGCLAADGDKTAARPLFEQAVAVYEALGAEADLSQVRAEFRGYGIRRGPHGKHRRADSGFGALTGAERTVAALIGEEGLSNPDIAARLSISPRTAGTHVSSIIKKLGVNGRADIAREYQRWRSGAAPG